MAWVADERLDPLQGLAVGVDELQGDIERQQKVELFSLGLGIGGGR